MRFSGSGAADVSNNSAITIGGGSRPFALALQLPSIKHKARYRQQRLANDQAKQIVRRRHLPPRNVFIAPRARVESG